MLAFLRQIRWIRLPMDKALQANIQVIRKTKGKKQAKYLGIFQDLASACMWQLDHKCIWRDGKNDVRSTCEWDKCRYGR